MTDDATQDAADLLGRERAALEQGRGEEPREHVPCSLRVLAGVEGLGRGHDLPPPAAVVRLGGDDDDLAHGLGAERRGEGRHERQVQHAQFDGIQGHDRGGLQERHGGRVSGAADTTQEMRTSGPSTRPRSPGDRADLLRRVAALRHNSCRTGAEREDSRPPGELQELCTPARPALPRPAPPSRSRPAGRCGPRPAAPAAPGGSGPRRSRPTRDRNARARSWQGRRGRRPARVASPA